MTKYAFAALFLVGFCVAFPLTETELCDVSMEIDTLYSDTLEHTGDYNIGTGDTLHLTNTFFHLDGELYVSGSGIIILENSALSIAGNVYLSGNAVFRDSLALIRFRSDYLYQYTFNISGNACYNGVSSVWHFENWIGNLTVLGDGSYEATDIQYIGGPTTTLLGNSRVVLNRCQNATEFVILGDSVSLELHNCENILVWLGLPDGAVGTLSPPGGMNYKLCEYFEMSPVSGTVDGIPYTVIVDSSTMWWGTIPSAGCSVTVESCTLRTTGVFMDEPRVYNVSGIADSSFYDSFELGLPDRFFGLNDVYMVTWNLYGNGTATININDCIFGECLAMGNCEVSISNSICDGTSGWLGSTWESRMTVRDSWVFTIVQTQGRGRIDLADTYVLWNIQSTNSGLITALDVDVSEYSEIAAHDSAELVWAKITSPTDSGTIGDGDSVIGQIFTLSGPDADVDLADAFLTILPPDSFFWRPLGDTISYADDDAIAIWDVGDRPAGLYDVRLNILRDPDIDLRAEYIFEYVPASIAEISRPGSCGLAVKPNPFNSACRIAVGSAASELCIFNISGRKIREYKIVPNISAFSVVTWDGRDDLGNSLPSGIYFARASNGENTSTKKFILVR